MDFLGVLCLVQTTYHLSQIKYMIGPRKSLHLGQKLILHLSPKTKSINIYISSYMFIKMIFKKYAYISF